MSTFSYNNNIPAASNNPSADQPLMLTNTQSTNSIIGVDHYSFGQSNNDGWHRKVTLLQTTTPPSVVGQAILYNKSAGGSSQLWLVRDGFGAAVDVALTSSKISKPINLTNNYIPQSGGPPVGTDFSAGVTFLAGDFLYQFGSFNQGAGGISPSSGIVKFPATFTDANSIIVIISFISKVSGTSATRTISVITGTTTTTQFQWNCDTSTTAYVGFNWTAIGN